MGVNLRLKILFVLYRSCVVGDVGNSAKADFTQPGMRAIIAYCVVLMPLNKLLETKSYLVVC